MTRRTADRRATTEQDRNAGERGMSEVLGFALVFALVVSTTVLVAVVGFDELENTRDQEELNNAERAFDVLADNMADIHADGAPSRATEINLESAQLETGKTTSINITITNSSVPPFVYTVEPLVFSSDGVDIVYSAGAIFRDTQSGGLILKKPPIEISKERALISIVQLQNDGDVMSASGGTVRIRAVNTGQRPIPTLMRSPPSKERMVINITSPRSDLWKDYLESQGTLKCEQPKEDNVRCSIESDNLPSRFYVSTTLINYAIET
ncbi:putative pilin/flagellin [Halapricum desulfuricans]|uniref:Putative pilin/flagellin n=1 Tax=Halapricum desulfuricans TaxID=2841257 RepID=A0A897NAD6_9EURY|nr:hypothetical protein [Halapricum desulfuricans]QSG11370.1 putative pilin/flagellin [Halapricum desulfuricans]